MDKEFKQITKLNKSEKIKIFIDIIIALSYIPIELLTNNNVWIVCGVLWLVMAIQEYLNIKTIKLKDDLIKKQNNFIEKIILEIKNIT